jgi:hypothetical protein
VILGFIEMKMEIVFLKRDILLIKILLRVAVDIMRLLKGIEK